MAKKAETNPSQAMLRFFVESSLARNVEIAVIDGKCTVVGLLLPGEHVKRSRILQTYVEVVDAARESEDDAEKT